MIIFEFVQLLVVGQESFAQNVDVPTSIGGPSSPSKCQVSSVLDQIDVCNQAQAGLKSKAKAKCTPKSTIYF